MISEEQVDRPDFREVYEKCKEYVDKLQNKKIGINDEVRQKINQLNVKGIDKKSNNSFDEIVNIIHSAEKTVIIQKHDKKNKEIEEGI